EVLLTFSDDDNKLACNEWQQGVIGIWDPFVGNRIFQIHGVPGALTAFSESSELFATCSKAGLGVRSVTSGECVFQREWPNKDEFHRPSYVSFTSASELVTAFESRLVVIEVSTGKVVKTYPFGESGRASLLSIAGVGDSYIAYYTEPTSQGER